MGQDTHSTLSLLPSSIIAQVFLVPTVFILLYIVRHVVQQLIFADKNEPPVVFSWLPFVGSTIEYGIDPYKFYDKCQKKVRFWSFYFRYQLT
jgi:sterol 14-demethylase